MPGTQHTIQHDICGLRESFWFCGNSLGSRALQEQGINSNYIKLIRDIYTDNSTTVCLHKDNNKIKIKKWVRQGDTISSKLFIAWLKKIVRTIDWTKKGININGEKLNHLRFADDNIIIAKALKEIDVMLQELDNSSRKCGLKMNMRKTKIMAGTTRTTKAVYVIGSSRRVCLKGKTKTTK